MGCRTLAFAFEDAQHTIFDALVAMARLLQTPGMVRASGLRRSAPSRRHAGRQRGFIEGRERFAWLRCPVSCAPRVVRKPPAKCSAEQAGPDEKF